MSGSNQCCWQVIFLHAAELLFPAHFAQTGNLAISCQIRYVNSRLRSFDLATISTFYRISFESEGFLSSAIYHLHFVFHFGPIRFGNTPEYIQQILLLRRLFAGVMFWQKQQVQHSNKVFLVLKKSVFIEHLIYGSLVWRDVSAKVLVRTAWNILIFVCQKFDMYV